MVREYAQLTINPHRAEDFEYAVAGVVGVFRAATGCLAMRLERVLEHPGVYRLVVDWKTIEHHTELFRQSPGFADWRAAAEPFFTKPPSVVHCAVAGEYF